MSITDKRLTEIQARLAAATEGPWSVDGPAQCGPEDSLSVYPVEDGGTLAYVQPSWDDAEFIAHAREDIPALLAEVERLRARLVEAIDQLPADQPHPRRFGSLADIPEDVERVAGKYLGYPCELARSPLSGTGWMIRVDHPYTRQQWDEYMDLDEDDLTDIEEVIGHE